MRSKRKKNVVPGLAHLVQLGLVDRPEEARPKVEDGLVATLAAFEKGQRQYGIKLRFDVSTDSRLNTDGPRGAALAAWTELMNDLSLVDQTRALLLSERFGPDRFEAGQRILDREAEANELEQELVAWVEERGGDGGEVEVTYEAHRGVFRVEYEGVGTDAHDLGRNGREVAFEYMSISLGLDE